MNQKIIDIIYASIDELNESTEQKNKIIKSLEENLYGKNSKLDSLGLVNLIVSVEQNIEDEFDVSITLANENALSIENSPFQTIGSLAEYVEKLVSEEENK